jgi:hypothetical protein
MSDLLIREYVERDWADLWPFLRELVSARETFPYPAALEHPTHGRVGLHVMHRYL